MADNTAWWNGANDFLGNLATTTTNVNKIKATVDNFGKSSTELALEEAQLKQLNELKRLDYQSQVSGSLTAPTKTGFDNNALLIGGAILGAFLLLG